MPLDRMEAFRQAVAELGDAPAATLSSFMAQKFGVRIEPKYIPFFRATLHDLENTTMLRQTRRANVDQTPELPFKERATIAVSELPQTLAQGRQRLHEVRQLAQQLLAAHGLVQWSFAYNRRKQAMGLCVFHRHTIELSHYFVIRNEFSEIVDTILHEIAHALVGPGHGHDVVWKQQCLAIGARPVRCGEADMPAGRWQANCPHCRQHFHRHRKPQRPRGWFCRACGPELGKLAWKEHLGLSESA